MTDVFTMSIGEIQDIFLQGTFATYVTQDIDGHTRYAADIVWRAAQRNGINPKVIIVMLQKEQSLVTDPDPSMDQIDWALGYGVCDDCTHDDPAIQRWKGFAKQVNSATLQLSEGYLADLASYGQTTGGYAPGQTVTIDGETFVIANNATAALYTYTPHLEGNENFVRLWQKWFGQTFLTGTLIQNVENGGIWLIQDGQRRPITSQAAYLSRYGDLPLISSNTSTLAVYPIGLPIAFPNYSLLKKEDGTIYLLVDDTLRHIETMEAFRQFGFKMDEVIDIPAEDLMGYTQGTSITVDTLYPQGALLQHTTTGGVYYVQNGLKHPIPTREIWRIRFPDYPLLPSSEEELNAFTTGEDVTFLDGTLVGINGESTIYVISEGMRRPITNESVFIGFGWNWDDVIWTDKASVEMHPMGEEISSLQREETDKLSTAHF